MRKQPQMPFWRWMVLLWLFIAVARTAIEMRWPFEPFTTENTYARIVIEYYVYYAAAMLLGWIVPPSIGVVAIEATLPVVLIAWVRWCIRDMRAFRSKPAVPETLCDSCGYDMRGSPSERCSECGTQKPKTPRKLAA